MSKARESHRKLCVEEIAMLRLGGVASRTYLVAFPAIKQHFQQQGLDLDWVLYSSWDALVEAFVRREVGLDHGMGHLASTRPEKNERLPPSRLKRWGDLAILSHHHKQARD